MRIVLYCALIIFLAGCTRRHVETITIKGSDTEVNLVLQLAEAYMKRIQRYPSALPAAAAALVSQAC